MKLYLKSEFHNTETYLIVNQQVGKGYQYTFLLKRRQLQNAMKRLCGLHDCCCPVKYLNFEIVNTTYDRDYIIEMRGL